MRLSITTPRGALLDSEVDEITAPGVLGEFGVLPGHVPLMSALKPGVLVYRAKDKVGVLAVGKGFLQVAPVAAKAEGAHAPADRVLVLCDQALPAGQVDRAAAERDLQKADADLAQWKGDQGGEYQSLLLRRHWAAARVDAAARASAH